MAKHPATLQVRMPIAQREAIDWYAEKSGVGPAAVARFFLPSRVPADLDRDDPAEVAATLDALRAYAEVELDREIETGKPSIPRDRAAAK